MEHPLTIEADIGSKVKDFLVENGVRLNYDSSRGTYRPWYRREVEVNYVKKGRRFSDLSVATFSFKDREIEIPIDGGYKTIDDVAGALLHETGHADIWPIELPLASIGFGGVFYVVARHFDNPIEAILGTFAAVAVYHFVIGEIITEVYSALKYGVKNYMKLRSHKKSK